MINNFFIFISGIAVGALGTIIYFWVMKLKGKV